MEEKVLVFDDGKKVRISPPMYSGNTIKEQPGDLSKFTPLGNGVYGYQEGINWDPFKAAPPQDGNGGIVYFENGISKEDFDALLRIMRLQSTNSERQEKKYALFVQSSEQPGQDGYLSQARIVPDFGMKYLFGVLSGDEYENFPEQEIGVADFMWEFMQFEKKRWGTSFTQDKEKGLAGLFGGDGDFAREELSFGFMLENDYYGVCRIWSRAWLVTK